MPISLDSCRHPALRYALVYNAKVHIRTASCRLLDTVRLPRDRSLWSAALGPWDRFSWVTECPLAVLLDLIEFTVRGLPITPAMMVIHQPLRIVVRRRRAVVQASSPRRRHPRRRGDDRPTRRYRRHPSIFRGTPQGGTGERVLICAGNGPGCDGSLRPWRGGWRGERWGWRLAGVSLHVV